MTLSQESIPTEEIESENTEATTEELMELYRTQLEKVRAAHAAHLPRPGPLAPPPPPCRRSSHAF